jgi:hypothetical protein
MSYSKVDLLNDIHELVEKYITQELSSYYEGQLDQDGIDEIAVEEDSDGDLVDNETGNIWNLDTQEIIGWKDPLTGEKTWNEGSSVNQISDSNPLVRDDAHLFFPSDGTSATMEPELVESIEAVELIETVESIETAKKVEAAKNIETTETIEQVESIKPVKPAKQKEAVEEKEPAKKKKKKVAP